VTDQTRKYRKQLRAQSEQRTRERITESAAELHGTIGPSRTSISAVAAHAGVRRSTLYRHFPDEGSLMDACTAHWSAANPPPDLGRWATIEDPDQRLAAALGELYAYYEQTSAMLTNLFRDESTVPLVRERFAALRGYFLAARDTLMAGRAQRGGARRRTRAAIGHAVAFSTWKSLVEEEGISNADAAALMRTLVAAAG
jgi:AcrR family transcriptional regulator